MEHSIEIASLKDLPLLEELVELYYRYDNIPWAPEVVLPTLRRLLENGDRYGKIFVARDAGGQFNAYLILTWGFSIEFGGVYAYIDEFFVREELRSHGLGSKLLAAAEAILPSLGVKALHLEVEAHNPTARKYYQAKGFEDLGRTLLIKTL